MLLDDEGLTWMPAVLATHEESYRAARDIAESRDAFSKGLVDVAKEDGVHKSLAKLFHGMFPDRFAYLGKRDDWFSFKAPRWWHISSDTEDIVSIINNKFSSKIEQALAALASEDPPDNGLIKKISRILKKKYPISHLSIALSRHSKLSTRSRTLRHG
jgi:hypothetical protein